MAALLRLPRRGIYTLVKNIINQDTQHCQVRKIHIGNTNLTCEDGDVNNSSYKIEKLSSNNLEASLELLRESFFPDEQVCKCVNLLTDSPRVQCNSKHKCTAGSLELEGLAVDTAKDSISLVAVDNVDDRVVGVAFNKIQVQNEQGCSTYFQEYANANIKDESAKALVQFMVEADAKIDLYKHFGTKCILELMILGVAHAQRGKGIGLSLVNATIKAAQNSDKDPKPDVVSAIFTSCFSRNIGAAAGMVPVLVLPYTEFSYKGRKYSEVAGSANPICHISGIDVRKIT